MAIDNFMKGLFESHTKALPSKKVLFVREASVTDLTFIFPTKVDARKISRSKVLTSTSDPGTYPAPIWSRERIGSNLK
jgi:hypothetical protein